MSIITIQASTKRVFVDGVPMVLRAYGLGPNGLTGIQSDLNASVAMLRCPLDQVGPFFDTLCWHARERFRKDGIIP